MVFCENGKSSKKVLSNRKKFIRWIGKRPKLFAFIIAVFIIAGVAVCRPDYTESVAKAFVLLIGVGL